MQLTSSILNKRLCHIWCQPDNDKKKKKKKPRKTSSWVCTLGNYLQNMLHVLKWNEKPVTYRVVYSVWYGRKWYAMGLKLQQVTLRDGFELKFHHSCLSISSLYILHTSDRRNNKRGVCVRGRGGWGVDGTDKAAGWKKDQTCLPSYQLISINMSTIHQDTDIY